MYGNFLGTPCPYARCQAKREEMRLGCIVMTNRKEYEDKALHCAATAQVLSDPAERAAMLCIAQDYLSLARFVEARNKRQDELTRERWNKAA